MCVYILPFTMFSLLFVSEGNTGFHLYRPWLQLISGIIVQDKEKWAKVDKEMGEKESKSNLQPNPGGRNHLDSAILLSDLLIKVKKENDLENKKNESGAKLEKRDVVDSWIKVDKPGKDEENPGKSRGDPDYRNSAKLLNDLLIKMNKEDNADEKKAEKKIGTKKKLKPPSSMLTAILGLSKLILWRLVPAIANLNFAVPLLQNSKNSVKSSNITYW